MAVIRILSEINEVRQHHILQDFSEEMRSQGVPDDVNLNLGFALLDAIRERFASNKAFQILDGSVKPRGKAIELNSKVAIEISERIKEIVAGKRSYINEVTELYNHRIVGFLSIIDQKHGENYDM